MPASSIAVFNDPSAFEAALKHGCSVELLVDGQGRFQADLISIVLPRLRLLRGKERLSRVAAVTVAPGSVLVILPTVPYHSQLCGGARLLGDEIVTAASGERLYLSTSGPCDWGIISVSAKELISYGQAVVGRYFNLASGVARMRPSGYRIQSLMQLFRAAMRVTEAEPSTPISTEGAIRGLEQEVIRALLGCLSTEALQVDVAAHQHRATMVRLDQLLANHDDRVPNVSVVSAALGISARTLQACCRQQVGVSAGRYLRLHGMRRSSRR